MRDVTTHRTWGGAGRAFQGLAWVAFGLFAVFPAIAEYTPVGSVGTVPPPFAALGVVCCAVGAWLMFSRGGFDLDARARAITWWTSFLGLRVSGRTAAVEDDALVTITREQRRRKKKKNSTTYTVFVVRVGAHSLAEPRAHAEARRLAEKAGKAFEADVEDRSLSPPSRRRKDQLDASLRKRYRGAPPPAPRPPEKPTCALRVEGRRVEVVVPPLWPPAVLAARGAAGCGTALAFLPLLILFSMPGTPHIARVVIAAFALVMTSFVFVRANRWARLMASETRIAIDRDALSVTCDGRTDALPLDQLEEVGFGSERFFVERLLLVSDAKTLEVALGLGSDERDWLADLIVWVAATGEAPPAAAAA